jgi:hypothetical protein
VPVAEAILSIPVRLLSHEVSEPDEAGRRMVTLEMEIGGRMETHTMELLPMEQTAPPDPNAP